jgi:hypothetical protein
MAEPARPTRLLVGMAHVRELAVKTERWKAPAERKGTTGAPGKGPFLGEV